MNDHFTHYLPANKIAGYSGFVVYAVRNSDICSYWMIPGTWEYDWDNR